MALDPHIDLRAVEAEGESHEPTVEKRDDEFLIFLSHREADAELAKECKRLIEDLAPDRLTVWCAKVDIPAGSRWNDLVRHALKVADLFLLLYTSEDGRWDWCNWEAGLFDQCERIEEPIVVLRSPGLNLPGPLEVYQCEDATHEALTDFLSNLVLGNDLVRHRFDAPLSTVSATRIAETAEQIAQRVGERVRTRYIPLQMNLRWTPGQEPVTAIPGDAVVEADRETLELFRVLVVDDATVTWDDLTQFHLTGGHLLEDSYGARWIDELNKAVAQLAIKRTPDVMTWRFRGHNRMGLFRPYLYKYERQGERLRSVSLLIIEEQAPKKVGGHRYNMLRSFERTWTEVVKFLRKELTALAEFDGDDDEWAQLRDQLRESALMVRNEEASVDPFEERNCEVVYGEGFDETEIGESLQARGQALQLIVEELGKSRDDFEMASVEAALTELTAALTELWPLTSQLYLDAVNRIALAAGESSPSGAE